MMAELHRPQITVGADWMVARIQNLHYAVGWFTADVRGVHLVSHNGANPGFRAAIVLVPSSKAGRGHPDKRGVGPLYRCGHAGPS